MRRSLPLYGLDNYKKRELRKLLGELAKVDGIEWIRLHYAYPAQFPMEIIDAIAENEKVCNYLDMPLQHAADNVLTAMRRNITNQQTRDLIQQIREKIPSIAIRTTLLVGFPGETDEDFEQLKRFIEESRIRPLGCVYLFA